MRMSHLKGVDLMLRNTDMANCFPNKLENIDHGDNCDSNVVMNEKEDNSNDFEKFHNSSNNIII